MKITEIITEIDSKTSIKLTKLKEDYERLYNDLQIFNKVLDKILLEASSFWGRPGDLYTMDIEDFEAYDFTYKKELEQAIQKNNKNNIKIIFDRLLKIEDTLQGVADGIESKHLEGKILSPKESKISVYIFNLRKKIKPTLDLAKEKVIKFLGTSI